MKDSDILRAAADVIKNGFAKEVYAHRGDGRALTPDDPAATCFCLIGAVTRVMGGRISQADALVDKWVVPLLPKAHHKEYPVSAREWNDATERTQDQVFHKLNEAADVAKLKGE